MSNPAFSRPWWSRWFRSATFEVQVHEQLTAQMPAYRQRLDARLIQALIASVCDDQDLRARWNETRQQPAQAAAGPVFEFWAPVLRREIEQQIQRLVELEQQFRQFQAHYQAALSPREARQHMLDYARDLGATKSQLREDERAFSRWFGPDALLERYQHHQSLCQGKLLFLLARLGELLGSELRTLSAQACRTRWQALALEPLLLQLCEPGMPVDMPRAALACLKSLFSVLPAALAGTLLSDLGLKTLLRLGMDTRGQIWVQIAALDALVTIAPRHAFSLLQRSLDAGAAEKLPAEQMFLRRKACEWLVQLLTAPADQASATATKTNTITNTITNTTPPEESNAQRPPGSLALLQQLCTDRSPYVRQGVAEVAPQLPLDQAMALLETLCGPEQEAAVRASGLLSLGLLVDAAPQAELVTRLSAALDSQDQPYVQRVAMQVCVSAQIRLLEAGRDDEARRWYRALEPSLTHLHQHAAKAEVRRWSARAREHLWAGGDPARWRWRSDIQERLKKTAWSRRCQVPVSHDSLTDEERFRLLSGAADSDFGLDVQTGRRRWSLRRGDRFGWRLWRWLHEWRNPDTDKRQAFNHTIGRKSCGLVQVQTPLLAELSETKVPGEPLYQSSESGWRPYLPLPDQLFAALDQGWPTRPLRLYSSEGVTELLPPRGIWARLRARTRLTRDFARLARLRNWQEGHASAANGYLTALQALGFQVRFCSFTDAEQQPYPVSSDVSRFFPVLTWPVLTEWWWRFEDYFFSPYQNSLRHLSWFLIGIGTLFVSRHLYLSVQINRLRQRMPLVIGGWGTRGKSGTERLKAALFNALGYSVISKTTGCEAMFLHGPAFGSLKEMFLYRPYDKATIWEQVDVLRNADALGAQVFLWECMGLTPSYVKILQRQWMRDDIATITNTYPDHENLQGPAGINIPQVMTEFIPRKGVLLTSEEQMLPVLSEAADRLQTRCLTVDWLEAGLLTSDILQRFPYEEHPYNIALVVRMSEYLDIDTNFALKEMADRVVPDLGVLKAYPQVSLWGRRLEYINGMSANERLACLGNWNRMGFADHDPAQEPHIWLSTVINNRADRIPRSQVFAAILASDIAADRHYLIGTNLDGFLNYLHEAWEREQQDFRLWPQDADAQPAPDNEPALQAWQRATRRRRKPCELADVERRVQAMLAGVRHNTLIETGKGRDTTPSTAPALPDNWQDANALLSWLQASAQPAINDSCAAALVQEVQKALQELAEFDAIAKLIQQCTGKPAEREACEEQAREQLWDWLRGSVVVIDDAKVAGNQIIRTLVETTPPGLLNRVIGMQNIKGAGLDFAYRWQAWEQCHRLCEQMQSDNPATVVDAVKKMSTFQEFGWLSVEYLPEVLARVRQSEAAQTETVQAELEVIETNFQRCLEALGQQRGSAKRGGWSAQLLRWAEAFLDAGDAVRRRKRAQRIYRDLAAQRISHARAVQELASINRRQQGGWLVASDEKANEPKVST